MLWIGLHFPVISLEIFSRGAAAPEPIAVIEKQGSRTRVIACNEAASACGVQIGMPVSAAQALETGLVVRTRDPAAEHDSLCGIAAWAGQFTPSVSLQPPDGLLLEVGSCLSLHRGLDNLLGKVRSGLDEMGYASSIAVAPTSHGAWLLALAEAKVVIREPARLEKILGALPVRLLDQPPETLAGLEMVGAHTLAECLRLPRAGMARRFGKGLLDELDRAFGRRPEAREFFEPPPNFARRLELPAQVNEAEGLLFAARRLLPELEGYLNLRQSGVQEFELICCHEDAAHTIVKLGFVQPTRSLERMQLLLRETLANTRLPAPVHTIVLNASHILPLEASNGDLFQEGTEGGDGNLLLERLRIRLGKEAVFGLSPTADHRPERAWRPCDVGDGTKPSVSLQRPLWLLPKPLRCEESRFVSRSGPERIESGWWDGMNVARDYYVAQGRNGSRLWIYHDHANGEWYVHGLFA
jgi:protein ImuB